jgi:hypothetical protein
MSTMHDLTKFGAPECSGLANKYQIGLKKLLTDKDFSLFCPTISDKVKESFAKD